MQPDTIPDAWWGHTDADPLELPLNCRWQYGSGTGIRRMTSMVPMTLVLLPGLDGTGLLFSPLVDALPPSLRPLVVPYPPDRVLGYEALADEVARQLPRDGPFVLVGESFGGPLATLLAARRPAGLSGLVLCATFVTSPRPVLGPLIRPFVRPAAFRAYPACRRLRGPANASPGSWAAAVKASRRVRPEVIAARVRAVLSVDVRTALAACPVPMLYLQAADDRIVPPSSWRLIERLRPDATLVRVPGSHLLLQRRPADCAAAIAAFTLRVAARTDRPSP